LEAMQSLSMSSPHMPAIQPQANNHAALKNHSSGWSQKAAARRSRPYRNSNCIHVYNITAANTWRANCINNECIHEPLPAAMLRSNERC